MMQNKLKSVKNTKEIQHSILRVNDLQDCTLPTNYLTINRLIIY